jgi:excisionase family DNA binding protein
MNDEPLLISVPEAARRLGLPRNAVYDLVRQGRIAHVRLGATGRRILIPRQALTGWVETEARIEREVR